MKSLWNMLCVVALANLLAAGGFVAWLGMSDRLSVERLSRVREVLAPTKAMEAEVAEQTRREEAKAAAEAAERARMEGAPESSAERIARQKSTDDAQAQANVRMQREIDDLRRTLLAEREALDAAKAELAAERKRFEDARAEAERAVSDKQFRLALGALEAQKPKDAYGVLRAMIEGRKREQAVAYLSAMDDTPRAKIMAEFIKVDETLAAGLLEQLRLHGVTAPMQADAAKP